MVGIVIVSHSWKIAEGIKDLCAQVAPRASIIAAGGMEDLEIGTDAVKIMGAISEAENGDGVVILADLGSGVMSAEMAIDLLDDETIDARMVDAPLVEGAVAAAVEAGCGSDIDTVIQAAEEARTVLKL